MGCKKCFFIVSAVYIRVGKEFSDFPLFPRIHTPVGLDSFVYDDKVLVESDASTVSFYLTKPHNRSPAPVQAVDLEAFTEAFGMVTKTDVPDRFKKFNLLVFESENNFTVKEFWVHLVQNAPKAAVRFGSKGGAPR